MKEKRKIPGWKDKVLFTPGPLNTSKTVKQAMLEDIGSWDYELRELVKEIRQKLLEAGQADPENFTVIPMQGCGTMGIEAVISSTVPPDGKLLVITNGAYGERIVKMATMLKIETIVVEFPENRRPDTLEIEAALNADSNITNVAVVHCETTTGIINPIQDIGAVVNKSGVSYFVDAMSSFGAVPIDLDECHIDYIISSANKCIEGVPGFSFVLARIDSFMKTGGYARSLSLDLMDQYHRLEKNGLFRFTPPTHALLAFRQALREFEEEGSVSARSSRYRSNYETLIAGMRDMGFKEFLRPEDQGHIITSFYYPEDPCFDFDEFYARLHKRNYIIYSGKITYADTFRIGNIGRIYESDIRDLLAAVREILDEMGIRLNKTEKKEDV